MEQRKEIQPAPESAAAARARGSHPRIPPRLTVGDRVVYASHGIGRIESREHRGANGELLILVFEHGMRVTLPLGRAETALRSLSGETELEEVQRTLGGDSPPPSLEHWSRRHRNAQAKFLVGSVGGLAEIVRDGARRESARLKRGTAPIKNQLYQAARKLLVAEVAAARGIELDAADAWIGLQIEGDPLATERQGRTRRAREARQ
jgi:RNA polymerase-interacting CarD/CdnL/TRCF family regulator